MKLTFNSSNSLLLQNIQAIKLSERKALINATITTAAMERLKTEKCILLQCKIEIQGSDMFSGCSMIKNFTVKGDTVEVQLKLMSDNVNIPYDLLPGC